MVIWVTGLSGAGKTTLCEALLKVLKPQLPQIVSIDGDVIRSCFGGDLGFAEQDRHVQIKRIQNLAKVLADQDLIVIVAALYSHPDLLAWNRTNLKGYFEIYLKVSLETVRRRDKKHLYEKARGVAKPNMVGIDIPWHAPERPDLIIDMDQPDTPESSAQKVIRTVPGLCAPR